MSTYYLITVVPFSGWGSLWNLLYKNKNNAENKFLEYARENNLYHDGDFRVAYGEYDDSKNRRHIKTIEMDTIWFED